MTVVFTPLSYSHLAVRSADELVFGIAPKPVRCGFGLEIGAGKVYPEVNFTLPAMDMTDETWLDVCAHYEEIGRNVVARAVHLKAPGLVLEFELLPLMTERPEWGAELTGILKKHMKAANEKSGLPSALRVTPTDIREKGKPPLMRRGEPWEQLRRSFELNAGAGADILSIESIGGKEVHDKALMNGDLPGIVLGLGVLAPRDMAWLWAQIRTVCDRHPGVVPGGDSACGFANTAMQLAGQVLEYDCRLMNAAAATGQAKALRDLLTLSDEWLSPQAAVLSPAATFEIASAVVSKQDPYLRTVAAGQTAVSLLRRGVQVGKLKLGRKEEQWLGRIEKALEELPGTSEELMDQLEPQYGAFYDKESYALACRE
jgi:hypothetical protein